jgi:hypothetical protein
LCNNIPVIDQKKRSLTGSPLLFHIFVDKNRL